MKQYFNRRNLRSPSFVIPMALGLLLYAVAWSEIIISLFD